MKAINWAQDQDLLQAGLLGIKPALVFVLVRGRNAWNSTWVRNYSGSTALLSSRSQAQSLAETRRVQGSVFYIREVPGIALLSDQGPVAMVEFHSPNSFGNWDGDRGESLLKIGTPLAPVLHALGHEGLWRDPVPSQHSFISGRAVSGSLQTLPTDRPLLKWRSKSVGADRPLQWTQESSDFSTSGVMAIIERYEAVNGEPDRAAAQERYWDIVAAAEAQARAADEAVLAEFLDTYCDVMWEK